MTAQTPIELAEQVATIARSLGIETTLIGAFAMAAHHYVRATADIDLATAAPLADLSRLEQTVRAAGFSTMLNLPDDQDPLGGKLIVWERVDDDGDPFEPVEIVNFSNPFLPRLTPAAQAIRRAITLPGKPALRYPTLEDLIALKLDAGGRRDLADVVELLIHNPNADVERIRTTCQPYGFAAKLEELIAEAHRQ